MLHKNVLNSVRSVVPALQIVPTQVPPHDLSNSAGLTLVASGGSGTPHSYASTSPLVDLIAVSAPRCAAFFAEAAVLVLVLALLDRLMAKGRMELGWIAGALAISLGLLAASIATDFTARRWLKAH